MATPKRTTSNNVSPNSAEASKKKITEIPEYGCVYEGVAYSHGSVMMQAGQRMRCNNGTWNPGRKDTLPSSTSTNKGTQ